MSSAAFDPLLSLSDVRLHQGADLSRLDRFEKAEGIFLPADHKAALRESNGVEAWGDYIRLFGVETEASTNVVQWNDQEFWKFAWNGRCSDYWCFAETAWGDQYAYKISDLHKGNPQVYFLDCLSMTPNLVASSFSEFLENEFIRSAQDPYDVMLKRARQVLGRLEIDTHLVYVPSILLGGTEDIAHVQKMNSKVAMICNGDIAIQLDAGPADQVVKGVTFYEDDFQRTRLRLIWEQAQ